MVRRNPKKSGWSHAQPKHDIAFVGCPPPQRGIYWLKGYRMGEVASLPGGDRWQWSSYCYPSVSGIEAEKETAKELVERHACLESMTTLCGIDSIDAARVRRRKLGEL